ncbi:MAG: TonB-dependent receptor plug domain-containing protein [Odoribacter sp.]|nr:TonB-dependent receptor plug domain-containing protein [Odoribacter sp.]
MNYLFKSFPAGKLIRFLCLIGFLITTTNVFAQSYPVTLQGENTTQGKVIEALKKQTSLDFFFSNEELDVNKRVNISFNNTPLVEALESMLGNGYNARIEGSRVIITLKTTSAQNHRPIIVKGTVKDSDNLPLPGVSIRLKDYPTVGATTDGEGNYTLSFPSYIKATLLFTFIGMKPVEVAYNGQPEINIRMEDDIAMMDEVVVTGIFERAVETFTGSVSSYRTEEIKAVGAQNVLQSLRTLDPSFQITPSNEFGSDPNRLPDINIQGKTSIVSFEEEYATDPNQPLFILDGFEVPLQTIVDLNMNRVASITLLKDAASTALYGSRAANGVVVVETIRPKSGELKVTYSGDFSVSIPDLTDYNMMNAAEKLEFERLAGFYNARSASNHYEQFGWTRLYNERLARVKSGVDSYWLSEPVRTGFTHKHNLYIYGGDDAMTYGLGVNYGGTNGVMYESGRDIVGMNMDLMYRKGQFRFNNRFVFDYTDAYNPPTPFSVFVQTNPYYEKEYEGSNPPAGWIINLYI